MFKIQYKCTLPKDTTPNYNYSKVDNGLPKVATIGIEGFLTYFLANIFELQRNNCLTM